MLIPGAAIPDPEAIRESRAAIPDPSHESGFESVYRYTSYES